MARTRNKNKEHPDIWEYAGTTDTEEHQRIGTMFGSFYHVPESHIFLVMLCQQLLCAEGTVGSAYPNPEHEILGKETQIFSSQKASYGNGLQLFHSYIIFISGRKCRPQRKKAMDPILQKFPIAPSFKRAKASTLHFVP